MAAMAAAPPKTDLRVFIKPPVAAGSKPRRATFPPYGTSAKQSQQSRRPRERQSEGRAAAETRDGTQGLREVQQKPQDSHRPGLGRAQSRRRKMTPRECSLNVLVP